MSEYDAATYERFSGAVQRQVHALRVILDNLQVAFPRMYTICALSSRKPFQDRHINCTHPRIFLAKFSKGKQLTSPFFLSRKREFYQ